jgi:hypothetical protein
MKSQEAASVLNGKDIVRPKSKDEENKNGLGDDD